MGEMAAVGQAHGQHHFPGLQSRYVDGLVCGRARMRLYVRVFGAVEGLRPLDGEGLNLIDTGRSRRSSACPGSLRRTCW